MSTLERHGLWGWRFAGAVAAIALYYFVVQPAMRAAYRELVAALETETAEP